MEIKSKVHPRQLKKITAAADELKVTRLKIYELFKSGDLDYINLSGSPVAVINEKYKQRKAEVL